MNKLYTYTEHGLLEQPLISKEQYVAKHRDQSEGKSIIEWHTYRKETAIPVTEGFGDVYPIDTTDLVEGVHFDVDYLVDMSQAEPEPFTVAVPIVSKDSLKDAVVNTSMQTVGELMNPAAPLQAPPLASHPSTAGNSIEQIKAELFKIESLKYYTVHASTGSFQVYDRRTDDMIIDADFKDNLMDNMIDGLFGQGSLYEYLFNREQNDEPSVATDDDSTTTAR